MGKCKRCSGGGEVLSASIPGSENRHPGTFSPSEQTLLSLIQRVGGSYCPGTDAKFPADTHRLVRKMERKGLLTSIGTDDGPRFSLTRLGMEAAHG